MTNPSSSEVDCRRPAWRKALWCDQPFDDNHTDENFLECLVVNADVVRRRYWRVVWGALAIDQQVCIAAIVASVAYRLYQASCRGRFHCW